MGLMIQVVAVMCMFQFGIVISSIGALKLSVARDLKLDNRQVAGMISALMLTARSWSCWWGRWSMRSAIAPWRSWDS